LYQSTDAQQFCDARNEPVGKLRRVFTVNGILEMEKGAPSGTLRPNLAAALNPRDAAAFEGVPRAGNS
jgi:hypothetical protein